MTRRELIGMASVGAVAIAVSGGVLLNRRPPAPRGTFPVEHTDAEWRAMLSPAAYRVLRQGGTETPFTSPLLSEHREGVFACGGCAKPVFQSKTKFDSHTGWPSFWEALPGSIVRNDDRSLAMARTEVRCARCDGHLGHVFTDGPPPTGLGYCMNGVAMTFQPAKA